ncbi:MAG: BMP family ABC transporter substrate-binding protein [Lachnospiraceae bacterium]|nr:BMP family ABC transporter substrate-binding protein [Lachnospiraceae bacterium]
MKKYIIAFIFTIVVIIVGMLLINETVLNTDITATTTNVGLVMTGNKDDVNYCQIHYESLLSVQDELNLNIVCKEKIPEDENFILAVKELILKDGCKVIIAPSYGYGKYIEELAEQYPNICFVHPMGTESRENLTSVSGRMYQVRYLSGIVAGMRTGSGEIGYVAAFPNSEVVCQINAFALGVRSISPDATVHVIYTNSWVDNDAAEKAGYKLLQKYPDIDVLTTHTNSLMCDRIAAEKGIYSIGFNKDNSELFPDSYLTACTWSWNTYYRDVILSYLKGRFSGKKQLISMEEGIVSLSELTKNCAPGTKEAVEDAIDLFESNTFDVFYGPIVDNNNAIRVPNKESMSDDEMLNLFNWYVKGVSIYEQ